MVVANMRATGMPLQYHNWMQIWCVDVHNVLASKNMGYQTPMTQSTGHTTDISKYRFYPWEPIWCYAPSSKMPRDNLKKARWLGFAHTAAGRSLGLGQTAYVRPLGVEQIVSDRSLGLVGGYLCSFARIRWGCPCSIARLR